MRISSTSLGRRVMSLITGATFAAAWSAAGAAAEFPAVQDLPARPEMPDPLLSASGERISQPQQWDARRREIQRLLQHYAIGHAPPAPGNVTGRELASRRLLNGTVSGRWVHLTFGPARRLHLDVALLLPDSTKDIPEPFPTIVIPSFTPSFGTNAPSRPGFDPGSAGAGATLDALAQRYALPLQRGYAVATFDYQQAGADRPGARDTGFFPAYPDQDWGALAAWAWAMSRCADYLETQAFADKAKLVAVGHSRLGKTALVAGAFDERFAVTAPAGSGCGGTGAYRFNGKGRGGKEGLEDATRKFPQWFGPRLVEFSGHIEKLPFDQHWFMALIAPRWFIAADGLEDPYANGNALAQAYLAAQPVYAFLGVPERLGISFRPGGHDLSEADWRAILDFADQALRQRKTERRFNELPPREQLH